MRLAVRWVLLLFKYMAEDLGWFGLQEKVDNHPILYTFFFHLGTSLLPEYELNHLTIYFFPSKPRTNYRLINVDLWLKGRKNSTKFKRSHCTIEKWAIFITKFVYTSYTAVRLTKRVHTQ